MSRRHRLALDRANPSAKSLFLRARKAEAQYARQLRKVARHIGDLVMGLFDAADPASAGIVERALRRYAPTIEAWAGSVGGRMVAEVAARDRKAWMAVSREMGAAIHREIERAPTGALLRARLAEQVSLITSLPTEAADRVHQLTIEGLMQGNPRERDRSRDHAIGRGQRSPRQPDRKNRGFSNRYRLHGGKGAEHRFRRVYLAHRGRQRCPRFTPRHGREIRAVEQPSDNGRNDRARRPVPELSMLP